MEAHDHVVRNAIRKKQKIWFADFILKKKRIITVCL